MKDIFISYSRRDQSTAQELCYLLESRGISCWIAPRDIPPGREFDEAILDGIDESRIMVVILSPNANTSQFVKAEVHQAFSRKKCILTLRIEDVVPAGALELYLRRLQWSDGFPPPLKQHVESLAKAIRHHEEAKHEAGAESVDTEFLTKNIYIDTVDGRHIIFQAGDKIPNKKSLPFETTDTSGMVQIPLLEGHREQGVIKIKNLSTSLPIGTPGQLSLEVTKDLDIIGQAQILEKDCDVEIRIEKLPLPPVEKMQDQFDRLRDDFDLALEVISDPNEKLKMRKKGRELIRAIDREFAHQPPNRPMIATMLEDLAYLVKKPNATKVYRKATEESEQRGLDNFRFSTFYPERLGRPGPATPPYTPPAMTQPMPHAIENMEKI